MEGLSLWRKLLLPLLAVVMLGAMLLVWGGQQAHWGGLDTLEDQRTGREFDLLDRGEVNINLAGVEELMELPGIGRTRAEAIVQYRRENGPFRYVEDLIRVPGIGQGLLESILEKIAV